MNSKREAIFTTTDPTVIVQRLVSLKNIRVLAYHRAGPRQMIEIEQILDRPSCPACGQEARLKDRPLVAYTDLPVYARPMSLLWRKHRWFCPNPQCRHGSWVSQDHRIAPARGKLTTRAGRWATSQVGHGRTVSDVAAELGCDWHTINDAVAAYGHKLLTADRSRITMTDAVGLDETSFVKLNHHHRHYVTTVCDVAHHQIIDLVGSRHYVDVAAYLHARPSAWKTHIRWASLDMSPTYRAVFTVVLPQARQIADHFHVIRTANRALDQVRQRVQHETLGHRGRKTDPLYRIRRLLCCGQERLAPDTAERVWAMLALGDPRAEVALAYRVKERLREVYQQTSLPAAQAMLDELICFSTAPAMPAEISRLGRTLKRWHDPILAWHEAHLSNSITEAMNNLIKRIKRIGFGFTNFNNYRIRVLLYAGKPNWRLLGNIFLD